RGGRTAGPPTARRPAGAGRSPDAARRRRPRVGPVGPTALLRRPVDPRRGAGPRHLPPLGRPPLGLRPGLAPREGPGRPAHARPALNSAAWSRSGFRITWWGRVPQPWAGDDAP